ncbi:MAG: THUMP domain-containing class I SAM-dependent RNA methyltransferase [Bacilli bacterium]
MPYTLMATAPLGLEAVVTRELESLGFAGLTVENGRVLYQTDAAGICRSNLWLRTADRVMLVVGQFTATTFDELFEGTKALPWAELLPKDASFPVEGRSVKSQLSSVPACQSIVKRAIVASLEENYGQRWFEESGASYAIEASLLKDTVTIALDTSGQGLHKRGYRTLTGPAPLKETLAAALILLSRWTPQRPFADPLCGTGTLAVEAALIGANIAPGHARTFACESFAWMPAKAMETAKREAFELRRPLADIHIHASDIDTEAARLTARHAELAGVTDAVRVTRAPLAQFSAQGEYGCIVTNPPYGERMGSEKEVRTLYKDLGRVAQQNPTWSVFTITSHPAFERLFGRRADKNRKLYNGRIECHFYQYLGPLPPRKKAEAPPERISGEPGS